MKDKQGLPEYMDTHLKSPFQYFGGKSAVASVVWSYLGDVPLYIEPFFGSGAVLLRRPQTQRKSLIEIINDKDGFIANLWRAIQYAPQEVAKYCDWPVNHADLNARRKYLIEKEASLLASIENDSEWFDAKTAGYWIWMTSCRMSPDKKVRSIPNTTSRTGIRCLGYNVIYTGSAHKKIDVYGWMDYLSKRLRYVTVICGDWNRCCGGKLHLKGTTVGMFFDPPYATEGRNEKLYNCESMTVGKDVEAWCLQRGNHSGYRIVIAGYDDEYKSLVDAGWSIYKWSAQGGWANTNSRGSENRHRERLYISPHCLNPDEMPLFKK